MQNKSKKRIPKQKTNTEPWLFSDDDFIPSMTTGNNGYKYAFSSPDPRFDTLFTKLKSSDFRRKFHLQQKDIAYIREKGEDTIRRHAEDFVSKRLAPAHIPNDGKQTPMRGHPVFIAQHATACCCRGCFRKWHHIPEGRELSAEEQKYAVDVIMEWIIRNYRTL